MFSGIVEEVGTILSIGDTSDGRRMTIAASEILKDAKIGDSISVSGVCLTICQFDSTSFAVDATFETLRRSKLGRLDVGSKVNLERALRLSDRLGGHLVSGHVDDVGEVTNINAEGFSQVIEFAVSGKLGAFFVEKGSVTIDGVSLTVAELKSTSLSAESFRFTVALIPHTLSVTTLSELKVGDKVNIEADLIGKYVARLVYSGREEILNKGGLSLSFLTEHGYT